MNCCPASVALKGGEGVGKWEEGLWHRAGESLAGCQACARSAPIKRQRPVLSAVSDR